MTKKIHKRKKTSVKKKAPSEKDKRIRSPKGDKRYSSSKKRDRARTVAIRRASTLRKAKSRKPSRYDTLASASKLRKQGKTRIVRAVARDKIKQRKQVHEKPVKTVRAKYPKSVAKDKRAERVKQKKVVKRERALRKLSSETILKRQVAKAERKAARAKLEAQKVKRELAKERKKAKASRKEIKSAKERARPGKQRERIQQRERILKLDSEKAQKKLQSELRKAKQREAKLLIEVSQRDAILAKERILRAKEVALAQTDFERVLENLKRKEADYERIIPRPSESREERDERLEELRSGEVPGLLEVVAQIRDKYRGALTEDAETEIYALAYEYDENPGEIFTLFMSP